MLAAIAVGEAVLRIPDICRSGNFLSIPGLFCTVALVSFVLVLAGRGPETLREFSQTDTPSSSDVIVEKMRHHAPDTRWVVTDMPMYAFRAGIPVPPHLTSIFQMRMKTGELTEEEIIDTIRELRPEQVLIARFKMPVIKKYLKEDYRLEYSQPKKKLYLLK
jgi:hypothetical protein